MNYNIEFHQYVQSDNCNQYHTCTCILVNCILVNKEHIFGKNNKENTLS